jgi:septum formation topological specificity factor MinE
LHEPPAHAGKSLYCKELAQKNRLKILILKKRKKAKNPHKQQKTRESGP